MDHLSVSIRAITISYSYIKMDNVCVHGKFSTDAFGLIAFGQGSFCAGCCDYLFSRAVYQVKWVLIAGCV